MTDDIDPAHVWRYFPRRPWLHDCPESLSQKISLFLCSLSELWEGEGARDVTPALAMMERKYVRVHSHRGYKDLPNPDPRTGEMRGARGGGLATKERGGGASDTTQNVNLIIFFHVPGVPFINFRI